MANLVDPLFDGTITYDAPDDGTPNGGHGIEIFAAGTRNPFGLVLHSSGNLYGTDNGSNLGYGDMMTGCGDNDFMPDVETEDKINLLLKGHFYGHPNSKRAALDADPRQCVWRKPNEEIAGYTSPLLIVKSSMDGIIEFQTDHFDGQMRGNLILSKYTDGLFRVILTADGTGVIPQSDPPLYLVGDNGLSVCQAPNGNLIEARLGESTLFVHKPNEPVTVDMIVKGVFPTRGGVTGGIRLDVYGVNFPPSSSVTVGGASCPIVSVAPTKIVCTVPFGSSAGLADVVVTAGVNTSVFKKGFRFISGIP